MHHHDCHRTYSKTHIYRAAADGKLNDAQIFDFNHAVGSDLPDELDVVVGGGFVHDFIYAIHFIKYEPKNSKISFIEKICKLDYKIGKNNAFCFCLMMQGACFHARRLTSKTVFSSTFPIEKIMTVH